MSKIGVPIQNTGNVLNLAFFTGLLIVIITRVEHIDTTLDYSPLYMSIN
jgi:hypothetical protein